MCNASICHTRQYLLLLPIILWKPWASCFSSSTSGHVVLSSTSNKVLYHPVSKASPWCYLYARVCPMRTGIKDYKVWALVKKTYGTKPGGQIFSAYCTCTVGLLGPYNRVADWQTQHVPLKPASGTCHHREGMFYQNLPRLAASHGTKVTTWTRIANIIEEGEEFAVPLGLLDALLQSWWLDFQREWKSGPRVRMWNGSCLPQKINDDCDSDGGQKYCVESFWWCFFF